ncbi:MAG: hypothetical protein M1838_003208 [Thelocarpon superellum]|nr:MAG: hypothetical protein M1838_003208 [Thelocarpon superellum]
MVLAQLRVPYIKRLDSVVVQATLDLLDQQRIARLTDILAGFDRDHIFAKHLLDVGANVTFNTYAAALAKARDDVFAFAASRLAPRQMRHAAATALHGMEIHHPWSKVFHNVSATLTLPHAPFSTVRREEQMPRAFKGWQRLNPDLAITIFDDQDMDTWLHQNLTTDGPFGRQRTNLWERDFQLLRPVLKSDLFRYLAIFVHGGWYGDSSSSSVEPIEKWGNKGPTCDWTDPVLP